MTIHVIYKKTQLLKLHPSSFPKKESGYGSANFLIFETLSDRNACCQLQSSAWGHLPGSQDRGSTLSLVRCLAGYDDAGAALGCHRGSKQECQDPSSCSIRGKLWLTVPSRMALLIYISPDAVQTASLNPLPKLLQVINCTPFSVQEAGAVIEKPMGKSTCFVMAYRRGYAAS